MASRFVSQHLRSRLLCVSTEGDEFITAERKCHSFRDQRSTRSEASGMYGVIGLVNALYTFYHVIVGRIDGYCDGEFVVTKKLLVWSGF